MNKERFKALIKMGFTMDEAFEMMEELPDPQPEPQPEQQPDPQPEPQQEPQQGDPDSRTPAWFASFVKANNDRMDALEAKINSENVKGAEADPAPEKSFDDIMREAYEAIR